MDDARAHDGPNEYSILFSDDGWNLFGDHSFGFALSELATSESLGSDALDNCTSEDMLSWELDDHMHWNIESNTIHSESPSDEDCVMLTPEPTRSQATISAYTGFDSSRSNPKSTSSVECQNLSLEAPAANKRKWESSIVVFSSNPDTKSKVKYRRRKGFDEARRKEVAMNRIIGACVQCKLRKGSCNFGIPCTQCIKRTGSATLGQELCSRQSLVTVRFNNIDLFGITHYEELFEVQRHSPVPGTRRESYIFWPNCCHRSLDTLLIKVQIEDFAEKLDNENQLIIARGYRECVAFHVPDSSTGIAKDSLPSLDLLADCCPDSTHSCNAGPFVGLHKAFSEFGELYCESSKKLPLQTLLGKTLRMKRLLSLYRRAAFIKSTPDDPESPIVPSWMKVQLRHHIGKGIVDLEAEIFDEFDRLLYGSESIGRRNPLATWVCLWILVLSYKEQMAFIHFHYFHDRTQLQLLYGLAKHIYNTLTSIYAALYQTTSPLTFDWRTNEISDMLGRESEIIKAFCNVKTEMYWFHGSKDQLLNEDTLFKKLVVENESKLLAAHRKAAKRLGVL